MTRATEADPTRRGAEIRGRRAEALAALLLRMKFYRILARRYRTPVGEIDIVARHGKVIVFVEVKERSSEAEAIEALTAGGRKRIARAADLWVAAHPAAAGLDRRFDVILAVPGRWPRHLVSVLDERGGFW